MTKVIIDDEYLFLQDLEKKYGDLSRMPPYIRQAIEGMLNPKNRMQIRENYRHQLDIIRRVIDQVIDGSSNTYGGPALERTTVPNRNRKFHSSRNRSKAKH